MDPRDVDLADRLSGLLKFLTSKSVIQLHSLSLRMPNQGMTEWTNLLKSRSPPEGLWTLSPQNLNPQVLPLLLDDIA